jgi:hypothetical protein
VEEQATQSLLEFPGALTELPLQGTQSPLLRYVLIGQVRQIDPFEEQVAQVVGQEIHELLEFPKGLT